MIGLFSQKDEKLNFFLTTNENFGCTLHFHKKIEIMYLLSGEHTAMINGEEYVAHQDEIFFVDSYDAHQFNSVDRGRHICMNFSLDVFKEVRDTLNGKRFDPVLRNKEANKTILAYLKEFVNFDRDAEGVKLPFLIQAGLVNLVIGTILKHYPLKKRDTLIKNDTIREIIIYLNENYNLPFDRDAFAKKFGYNTAYLSHLFKKQVGVGIVDYLKTIRYENVKSRLARPENKGVRIIDIVMECGWDSLSSYYRFASRMGDDYNNVLQSDKNGNIINKAEEDTKPTD